MSESMPQMEREKEGRRRNQRRRRHRGVIGGKSQSIPQNSKNNRQICCPQADPFLGVVETDQIGKQTNQPDTEKETGWTNTSSQHKADRPHHRLYHNTQQRTVR